MKKNLLAMAVAALFAVPGAAMADVKVYGKFNLGLESQKDEIGLDSKSTENTWRLQDQNDSSRLGVKGSEDVGVGELKVIYQLEYGVNPDGSEANVFSQRNIFVGLKGGFGTVKFGRYDTPVKEAGAKVDQFNDESIGDFKNLMVGETRANNMIQYSTPKFGDMFTLNLAVAPGEGRTALDDAEELDKSIADTYYASAEVEAGMVYGSLSYAGSEAGGVKFDGKTAGVDILRAAVLVKPISDLELGALYQQAKGIDQDGFVATGTPPVLGPSVNANGSDAKETSYLASLGYTIVAFKLKAQYGQTKGDNTDFKRNEMAFGVDYKLSKALLTQLYYVTYEDKDRTVGGIDDPETSAFGAAIVYSF